MNLISTTLLALGSIGAISAVILYIIARKFKVYEDPRIERVLEVLPAANCGGCGYPGCPGFADACVKADNLDHLFCPVGGNPVMEQVAVIVGKEIRASVPKIAVLRCNGSCIYRKPLNRYDGADSCSIEAALYGGETGCSFGCLGKGDCEKSCVFDALHINSHTLLPEIDEDKCTACGACVNACPKAIIELRKKGPKSRRIYVSCVSKDKGAVARKACNVACIGCGKCEKSCPFDAVTLQNNLAYIDDNKCRLCRKCVGVCPTGAIHAVHFPLQKEEVISE